MQLKFKKLPLDAIERITLFLLFLAGINFLNRYYVFCFMAVSIFILLKRKFVIDHNVGMLLTLSLSWILFSPDQSNFSLAFVIKPFLYPMAYIIGRNFGVKYKGENITRLNNDYIIPSFVILASGPFIHYIINYLSNIGSTTRNTLDVWTGQQFSATGQAALACMMISVAISALFLPTKKIVKVFSILCLWITISYNFILSGRTLLVLSALIILVCTLYLLRYGDSQQDKLKIISILVATYLIINICLSYNIFGLRDYLENTNLYFRFLGNTNEDVFYSGRLELKVAYFKNFEKSIFGGGMIKSISSRYAHDLFLDTYDEAGIFALLAVFLFVVRSFVVFVKIITDRLIDLNIRMYILSTYVAFYLMFFVEPILQGFPWLFMLFCVVHGMIEKIYNDKKVFNL